MEDCRPFVHVARLLRDAGVNAPEVLAEDLPRGFLLLTDLGHRTYLSALDDASAPPLYSAATDALILLAARHASQASFRPTTRRCSRASSTSFPTGTSRATSASTLTPSQRETLDRAFRAILDNNLAQPRVFVHRDYHSRNLMVAEPNPGVLDFQDAVVRADHLRPRLAAARCLRRVGRGAAASTGRRATGSAREARGLPVGADFADVLARLRMDGRAAPAQGARHLRAPRAPRRQDRLPRRHAARASPTCAPRAGAIPTLAPLAALLDALHERAAGRGLHVLTWRSAR